MVYNSRIQYAVDNFIEDNYFLPMETNYELKEATDSGKSLLKVHVDGENICVSEYDNKKRCGFLRISSTFGMQKCIDHLILKKSGENWDLHMVEMKSSVGDKTWRDIKCKMRSSFLNVKALCSFLGITLGETYAYTTYEQERFTTPEDTADPKILVPQLGVKATNYKKDEWDKDIINIKIDKMITLPHKAIKMRRDAEVGLLGELII
ncbi:hypothetical protein [Lacrimispora sp.]|uniref:hypothetical protein n=1 Tax=Lacrimispora sp. TaxID=2719234 RepID=UPI0029E07E3A|nr:hypothetical protein [Lacrimispora sp.]